MQHARPAGRRLRLGRVRQNSIIPAGRLSGGSDTGRSGVFVREEGVTLDAGR